MGQKLYGIDISHWNNVKCVGDLYRTSDFVIAKATEGISFKDPMFREHIENALLYDSEVGFYHYARPEKNKDPLKEADHFLNVLSKYGYIGKGIMALDWEGVALKMSITWARAWLDYVYQQTQIKPLFYCQRSYTDKIDLIRQGDFGLWVARYKPGLMGPECLDGKGCAIWQYDSRNIDKDIFYGSLAQFRKYYKKREE